MSLSHVTKLGLLGPGAAEDKNAKNKEIKKSGKRDDKDSKKKKKRNPRRVLWLQITVTCLSVAFAGFH